MMHLLAILCIAIPIAAFVLFLCWTFDWDWSEIFRFALILLSLFGMIAMISFGIAYLEYEQKAKAKQAEATAK